MGFQGGAAPISHRQFAGRCVAHVAGEVHQAVDSTTLNVALSMRRRSCAGRRRRCRECLPEIQAGDAISFAGHRLSFAPAPQCRRSPAISIQLKSGCPGARRQSRRREPAGSTRGRAKSGRSRSPQNFNTVARSLRKPARRITPAADAQRSAPGQVSPRTMLSGSLFCSSSAFCVTLAIGFRVVFMPEKIVPFNRIARPVGPVAARRRSGRPNTAVRAPGNGT